MISKKLFIAGCGHTGTSVLARIIGSHKSSYFINYESGVFLANRYFDEIDIIREWEKSAQGKLIVEKTPRHIWHIDYIRSHYSNSLFILTTRDGKECISSLYERSNDFNSSVKRYIDDSLMTLRQIESIDCYLVKYEKLIQDPKRELKKIFNFCGLDYYDEILNFHYKKINWNIKKELNKNESSIDFKHDILRNIQVNSPLNKNLRNWQERIPKEKHKELNKLFNEPNIGYRIMKKFGYK